MSEIQPQQRVDVNQVVADNLRAELARQRWSDRKAATRLGVTNTYVSRRTSGRTPLDPNDLTMFAAMLEVEVAYFFANNEKAPNRGGLGASLPDLDSNQEPPRSWLAPVSQLEVHRSAKVAAHSAVHSDRDAIVSEISFTG